MRQLAGERARTLLTLLGIALGVAVIVSIRLASHSALASFSDTVDAVTGRANLQIASRSDGFDEALFARIQGVPGILAAAPVVEVQALAAAGTGRDADTLAMGDEGRFGESLIVLGVDPFSEAPFARGGAGGGAGAGASSEPPGAGGWLRLVGEPRTIAITRALAARHALVVGDTLSVLASGVPVPLVVVQVLTAEDLQQAYGGNVALVDLATAQEVFHRVGRLDRIDLLVAPRARDRVRAELASSLPPDVSVDLPQSRTRQVENMVRAFDLNLMALVVHRAVRVDVPRVQRRGDVGRALAPRDRDPARTGGDARGGRAAVPSSRACCSAHSAACSASSSGPGWRTSRWARSAARSRACTWSSTRACCVPTRRPT